MRLKTALKLASQHFNLRVANLLLKCGVSRIANLVNFDQLDIVMIVRGALAVTNILFNATLKTLVSWPNLSRSNKLDRRSQRSACCERSGDECRKRPNRRAIERRCRSPRFGRLVAVEFGRQKNGRLLLRRRLLARFCRCGDAHFCSPLLPNREQNGT